MSGYDFLKGVRVIELAHLGPSSLGGHLADMGADVIKVEGRAFDNLRYLGSPALGSTEGVQFLHLRWNRGKRSVGLDVKTEKGMALFKRMIADADIVIEGMRAGVMERLGLSFEVLKELNPRIVFCSISGFGLTGPYASFASHAPSFDAFGGLGAFNPWSRTPEEQKAMPINSIGMTAMGLYAAMGAISALFRARMTGEPAQIEVTGAEAAAHWKTDGADVELNKHKVVERPGTVGGQGRQANWPRMYPYDTEDGKSVYFMAIFPKFWERFCKALDRPDLIALYQQDKDVNDIDDEAYEKLKAIFSSRTRAEWLDFFGREDVPGGPANTVGDLAEDPHFLQRDNVYEVEDPEFGPVRLLTTPIKTTGQTFAPAMAPKPWEHTDDVLKSILALDDAEIADLKKEGVTF